jgi:hypothetical protein
VALDNFQIEIAELLLQQSCQVAVSMGLHQQSPSPDGLTAAEVRERRNVFWTLSVLDKHFSLLTGTSCRLPSYDCAVPLPEPEPGHTRGRFFVARIRLARIQERIYVALYSAAALRAADPLVLAAVARLVTDLRAWRDALEPVPADAPPADRILALELNFLFYSSCIMVRRRSAAADDKALCLRDARDSLALLSTMRAIHSPESDAGLRR